MIKSKRLSYNMPSNPNDYPDNEILALIHTAADSVGIGIDDRLVYASMYGNAYNGYDLDMRTVRAMSIATTILNFPFYIPVAEALDSGLLKLMFEEPLENVPLYINCGADDGEKSLSDVENLKRMIAKWRLTIKR